ncbi:MAG: hypothetical protein ACE5ID_12660, partial [Acidobacteriota bacterium]
EGLLAGEVAVRRPPDRLDSALLSKTVPAPLSPYLEVLLKYVRKARADPEGEDLADNLTRALRTDLGYGLSILNAVRPAGRPTAILVRFTGLDVVKKFFMRYQRPDQFGNVKDQEIEAYGHVIADYYRFLDAWIGLLQAHVRESPRVMVISPYGLAPLDFITRAFHAVAGQGSLSGTYRGGGPGLLLAAGPDIRQAGRLEDAALQDVLPALLYLLDLPVGRDMKGRPLAGLVSDAYAQSHAVAAVPSWGTVQVVGPSTMVR